METKAALFNYLRRASRLVLPLFILLAASAFFESLVPGIAALTFCVIDVTVFLTAPSQHYVTGSQLLHNWIFRHINLSTNLRRTFLLRFTLSSDVQKLQEQLSDAQSRAWVHEKQARSLESRLTHEQIKSNKAILQLKRMAHYLSDASILGVNPVGRFKRVQLIRTSLLSFFVLWRQACIRAQRLERSELAASKLKETIRDQKSVCDNLRLDNSLLKVSSKELSEKLENAEGDKSDLSKQLIQANTHYRLSLLAREAAAESWIKYRETWHSSRVRCMRSLLLVITILWRFNRHLGTRLMDQMKETLLTKAQLARVQSKYDDVTSRYGILKVEHDKSSSNLTSLEATSKKQTKEINELRLKVASQDLAFKKAVKESVEARVQLLMLTKKYDSLQIDFARLTERCEVTGRDLEAATKRFEALETDTAEHVRSSGLSLALLARHLHQERVRMEEEKQQEFRPVHDMMADLRSRLAMADAYVQKMVSEPSTPVKTPLMIKVSAQLSRRMMALPSPPASATPSPLRP
ncbi:hypothetical protein EVG20_g9918 [Dentipellis fragilis]|uniref:Uncharacterized protein n=1 Tax=Dentipellis fragilis TaxID=205917 RepID=A0A4Y9XVV2_9AGAM|nr:hypothetical protein EVG20_g9918 [Dentipellis fragilis]